MKKKEIAIIEARIRQLDRDYDRSIEVSDNIVNLNSAHIKDRDTAQRLLGDYRGQRQAISAEMQFLKSLVRK